MHNEYERKQKWVEANRSQDGGVSTASRMEYSEIPQISMRRSKVREGARNGASELQS